MHILPLNENILKVKQHIIGQLLFYLRGHLNVTTYVVGANEKGRGSKEI
jgi:hypothetical protein